MVDHAGSRLEDADVGTRPDADDPSARAPRLSLGQRVWIAALTGFVIALVVGAVSIVTVSSVTGSARDARRLSEAGVANDEAIAALSRIRFSPLDAPTRQSVVAEIGAHAAKVANLSRPELGADDLERAAESDREFLRTVNDQNVMGGRDQFEAAVAERRRLGNAIEQERSDRDSRIASVRTAGIVVASAFLVLGSVVAVVVIRGTIKTLARSLRSVGRSMRRFGDGDLASRAPEGDDEIGLIGRSFNHLADRTARDVRFLRERSERAEQLHIISDALDLADDLDGIASVTRRSMGILAPGVPMELMTIASTGKLITEVSNPTAAEPACPVAEVNGCVALRRGQTSIFPSSEDLNSCPHLRNRPSGPCSAVCIPVNFGGELLGVVHSTAADGEPLVPDDVDRLVTMSTAVGARLGAIRQLESTRLEASTDGLTGLANRRMLESSLWRMLREGQPFVLVVADVDRFKSLNDTYGHEIGDRALQLFARVLEDNVRDHDIVARYGGEEFVLVYPELSVKPSMEVIERIRQALDRAQIDSEHGHFTASFGVTHSSVAATPDQIIRVADAGLLRAKELGRNRVVFADIDLAAEVFAPGNGVESSTGRGGDAAGVPSARSPRLRLRRPTTSPPPPPFGGEEPSR